LPDNAISITLAWLERHGVAYSLGSEAASIGAEGVLVCELPERLPPLDTEVWDHKLHECREGETLFSVAQRYYGRSGLVSWPVGLYEVILQVNSWRGLGPALDPFKQLPIGKILIIPGVDFIREVAFGDSLREGPEV